MLSVREPRALRDLTFFPPDVRAQFVPALQALFSRTFAADQAALLKATSFVSEIAAELVPADGRALFLYATPRSYIAGILAGENSRQELAGMAADTEPSAWHRAAWTCLLHETKPTSRPLPGRAR